jgi:hypothetical protein
MMAGRDSLHGQGLWHWVDDGVRWLNTHFEGKGLEFSTALNIDAREVRLAVFAVQKKGPSKEVFSVVEKIESFVSPVTVTKIIMLAG